jgi:hypothetical protein
MGGIYTIEPKTYTPATAGTFTISFGGPETGARDNQEAYPTSAR